MQVDIYSTTRRDAFIAVPHQHPVPSHLRATRLFKTVDLVPGEPRIGIASDEVLDDIAKDGWAAVGATTRTS